MPPKVRITKEDLVNTAVNIVRKSSAEAINARTVAAVLNCSTQPIFSNFSSMEELKNDVIKSAERIYDEYAKREIESGLYPIYKANGMAYIRFAKEEKELFKLLYMRDRSKEKLSQSNYLFEEMESIVHNNTGLAGSDAALFHLEMWAYVHGIATMFATGYLDLDWKLVEKMLTDAYIGLKKQYEVE